MPKVDMAFAFGEQVEDALTGFTGTVTGFTTFITGCDQHLVTPRCKDDGSDIDAKWLDVSRLRKTGGATVRLPAAKPKKSIAGGDILPAAR